MADADGSHAVSRRTGADQREQSFAGGKPLLVHLKRVADFPVRPHDRLDPLRGRAIGQVHRGGRDQAFGIPLIRVGEKPHERHRIVGLVLDVSENDDSRPIGRHGHRGYEPKKACGQAQTVHE